MRLARARPYFFLPAKKVGKNASVDCSHTLGIEINFCIRKNLPLHKWSLGSILLVWFSIEVWLQILTEQSTLKNKKTIP
jgi:hypothetical protein